MTVRLCPLLSLAPTFFIVAPLPFSWPTHALLLSLHIFSFSFLRLGDDEVELEYEASLDPIKAARKRLNLSERFQFFTTI